MDISTYPKCFYKWYFYSLNNLFGSLLSEFTSNNIPGILRSRTKYFGSKVVII